MSFEILERLGEMPRQYPFLNLSWPHTTCELQEPINDDLGRFWLTLSGAYYGGHKGLLQLARYLHKAVVAFPYGRGRVQSMTFLLSIPLQVDNATVEAGYPQARSILALFLSADGKHHACLIGRADIVLEVFCH